MRPCSVTLKFAYAVEYDGRKGCIFTNADYKRPIFMEDKDIRKRFTTLSDQFVNAQGLVADFFDISEHEMVKALSAVKRAGLPKVSAVLG